MLLSCLPVWHWSVYTKGCTEPHFQFRFWCLVFQPLNLFYTYCQLLKVFTPKNQLKNHFLKLNIYTNGVWCKHIKSASYRSSPIMVQLSASCRISRELAICYFLHCQPVCQRPEQLCQVEACKSTLVHNCLFITAST